MSILEQIVKIKKELLQDPKNDKEEVKAIITYLQFALDKIVEYNCVETRWHSARSVIAGKFDRHDYAFKWSYAEMDIIRKGFVWAVGNVLKAYKGLVELLGNSKSNIQVFSSPCQKLSYLKDETVDIVVVDPPYYDNVMYSEMSDFFYVWLKRGLGDLYPDLFHLNLTDKDNEAVANQSRFEGLGTSKKELAKQDYEAKMRDSFKEIHRMLKKHGILTIMFTHKATEAWDTLAKSLMDAGFEITASWPVSTESEHSLHIAKKNAVQTTILLVCRKRLSTVQNLWWEDDVLPKIKETIKQKRQC